MKRSVVLLFLAVIVCALFVLASCQQKEEYIQYGSISGRVLYSNGNDHSGILLTLDKTDGLRAITESDGSRSIEGICYSKEDGTYSFFNLTPGTYTVYASSNDALERAVSTNVYVSEGKDVTVADLNLTATGKITGRINVDGGSTGNEGFLVFVAGTSYMAATDDSGKYTITGIPAGDSYPVIASKGSYTISLGTVDVSALGQSTLQAISVNSDDILSGNDSIIWKGSYSDSSAITSPRRNWAFYNITDGCSYIFDGKQWTLLASKGDKGDKGDQGEQGIQGETGAAGSAGSNGVSISWKGSLASAPTKPELYWAYFNIGDGCSYIFDGTQWTLLASKGEKGEQGIQGEQGVQGETGATGAQGPQGEQGLQGETGATGAKGEAGAAGAAGADGVSIIWLGNFAADPENPKKLNAYYNTETGCSYIYDGTEWTLLASKGDKGDQGETGAQGPQGETGNIGAAGTNGTSITWKGSLATAPAEPSLYWAYFNTEDGCSYIYDGNDWTLLAAKGATGATGAQGEQGATGATGAAGADGVSIIWLGNFAADPENPKKLNAYYNTETGCSYIYNGTEWTLLASKGAQGEQGEQGPQGEQGETGATGATGTDGISIVWQGSWYSAPENPAINWAYFNVETGCSYIYDGYNWKLLAQKGDQGEQGPQGVQGEQGPQGAQGESGSNGLSIRWRGSLVSAPDNPQQMDAYFDVTTGCSYIYSGLTWTLLASKGEQGEPGTSSFAEVLAITCSTANASLTNQNVTIKYSIRGQNIVSAGYRVGSYIQGQQFFDSLTNTISSSAGIHEVSVDSNGTYCFGVIDDDGFTAFSTIIIDNIDKTAPEGINNLEAYYLQRANKIILSWDTVSEADVDFIRIVSTKNGVAREPVEIASTCTGYEIDSPEVDSEYSFTITVIDYAGNESPSTNATVTCNEWIGMNVQIGGRGPAGGFIFYDCDADNDSGNADGLISSECGWRYLEAAPEDLKVINSDLFDGRSEDHFTMGTYYKYRLKEGIYSKLPAKVNGQTASNSEEPRDQGSVAKNAIGEGKINTEKLVAVYKESVSNHYWEDRSAPVLCYDYSLNGYDDWFLPSYFELIQIYQNLFLHGIGEFGEENYLSSSEEGTSIYGKWGLNFGTGEQVDIQSGWHLVRPVRAFSDINPTDDLLSLENTILPTCEEFGGKTYSIGSSSEEFFALLPMSGHNAEHSLGEIGYCKNCGKPIYGPAGGYIIYDCDADNNNGDADGLNSTNCGWRYLEAAPDLLTVVVPGKEYEQFISGFYRYTDDGENLFVNGTTSYDSSNCTREEIGTGKHNTELLVSAMGGAAYTSQTGSETTDLYAAKVCDDFVLNGYDDWFLPSYEEAEAMRNSLSSMLLWDFSSRMQSVLWTSSELASNVKNMESHKLGGTLFDYDRGTKSYVQPIRSFL